MEYHEIDCVGRLWVEEVASLPTWHSSYYRRVLYRNSDGTLWFGNTSGWQRINTGSPDDYINAKAADIHAGTIAPSADNTIDLGIASTNRYANVYAVNFQGTTTTATYADLAEKYTTKLEYPVGTVLEISSNEQYDLEACRFGGDYYVGVISENPAFLMNSECDGQAVALVGKVPVRVIGPINKSQRIMCADSGVAVGIEDPRYNKFKIGFALETNLENAEKLVTCLLR